MDEFRDGALDAVREGSDIFGVAAVHYCFLFDITHLANCVLIAL